MDWITQAAPLPNSDAIRAANRRQQQLTKPIGALGELESVVVQLAGLQGSERPAIRAPWVALFAADHGVAADGVSAYPQAVTFQMVANFAKGGAAASVLARTQGARFEVIDVGVQGDTTALPGVFQQKVGLGTANCREMPAMTGLQLQQALKAGAEAVDRSVAEYADFWIAGEMGIGNTTIASALLAAALSLSAADVTGLGTGVSEAGLASKQVVIEQILARHASESTPTGRLAAMGGFEVAALCGAYIRAAQSSLPVLVDGFISSVAALYAVQINPSVRPWLLFGHQSAEKAHQLVLAALSAKPLLSLGMRLGEGSGALVALSVLRLACELHDQMATFAEAGVSEKED